MSSASAPAARFDVVALITSAGGLIALRTILRDLPVELPAAVIVGQHLGVQGKSALLEILGRHTRLPLEWASPEARLAPGRVFVCPPRRQLELLPDGTFAIGEMDVSARDKPLDALLESIADAYGPRALAVVLTGMGHDGAAGARAVKRAGGVVLVESDRTAEHPSMPRAAGVHADLVLPLDEIAGVIATTVTGGNLPRPRAEVEAVETLFGGPGDVRRRLAAIDWSRTPLGSAAHWPASLRTTLRIVLDSPMPMSVLWGRELIQLYNDRYAVMMGEKHPNGLGQPSRECWPEMWHLNEPIYARVNAGEAVALGDALYPVARRDRMEDAWFDLSFAPVLGDDGSVAGVLTTMVETTSRVLAQRRLRTLHALTGATAGAPDEHTAMQRALDSLCARADRPGSGDDATFALGYLADATGERARLVACAGVEAGGPMAPRTIELHSTLAAWHLASTLDDTSERGALVVNDLAMRFRGVPVGMTKQPPASAILLPLRPVADEPPVGVLVCGINPRLAFDAPYREFFDLVAAGVSARVREAQLRQRDRERLDRLAELDQAKTNFFNNVSHEFRTPLTLLLGPLEELNRRADLPRDVSEDVHLAARNARRLLNQVNTLLDFSQAESRRLTAQLEQIDLAALTRDIASEFRGAAERAGIALNVECPPLAEPSWVDPQMWETIVANLLSNALKFTFDGEIVVELSARTKYAELRVRDTGVGIPAEEQAHVFKRFHRVRGRRARTSVGSGIGLALVHELVRQLHGRVRVQSEEGKGTTMTVWLPLLQRPPETRPMLLASARPAEGAKAGDDVAALAAEAESWMQDVRAPSSPRPPGVVDDLVGPPSMGDAPEDERPRLLVVDDHADLRGYLARLFAPEWDVAMAEDATVALDAIRRCSPDMVIADVAMPGVDGLELVRRVRNDPALALTPIVLVTARAGEDAAVAGLRAGADDYIAKPFSPRELVARVRAVAERSRAEAALRERAIWRRAQREALEAAMNGASLEASLAVLVETTCKTLGPGTRAAFHLASDDAATRHHVVGMSRDHAEAVDEYQLGPDGGRGSWSFPIHTGAGGLVGTFEVYSRAPREPTSRELELASIFAQTASIIISRHTEHEARKRAQDRMRTMANIPGVGVLTFDEASGTVIDVNDAFLAMTGYARTQVERRELSWKALNAANRLDERERERFVMGESGLIVASDKDFVRADGSRARVLFTGAALGDGTVIGYCIDLGARDSVGVA